MGYFFITALIILAIISAFTAKWLAKRVGENSWFWFWISIPLPVVALCILVCLPEKEGTMAGENKNSIVLIDESMPTLIRTKHKGFLIKKIIIYVESNIKN